MAEALSRISVFFIPGLLTLVIGYGLAHGAPVYDHFISGAKDGLKSAVEILPFIIAIFVGIDALTSSGALEFLEQCLSPVFLKLGIPKELASLILLRPVSGSGSLVVVEKIVTQYGADSFVGRCASVMAGSCETVFYVMAVYFGATRVKRVRHALAVGVIGYAAGIFASVLVCRYWSV